MEVEELKKTWKAFDKHLEKESIVNEKQISDLIASYKGNANKKLHSLIRFRRVSMILGLSFFGLCVWIISRYDAESGIHFQVPFIAISILIGIWHDAKTYKCIEEINVYEMSILEISRRMTIFSRWMRYDIIALCIWIPLLNIVSIWDSDSWNKPISHILIELGIMLFIQGIVIYFIYSHYIYQHIKDIRKNINELKDICTE